MARFIAVLVTCCLLVSGALGAAEDEAPRAEEPPTVGVADHDEPDILVILENGKELKAISAPLVEGKYVIEMKGGATVRLSADQVKEVRALTQDERAGVKAETVSKAGAAEQRREAWLAAQYAYFRDKLVVLQDGTWYNAVPGRYAEVMYSRFLGRYISSGFYAASWPVSVPYPSRTETHKPTKGQTGMLAGSVFQILGPDSLLVSTAEGARFYVSSYPTEGYTDGQGLEFGCFVVAGTYRYATAAGGSNTVPSLRPVTGVTKEQFLTIFQKAKVLERWDCDARITQCPTCRGSGRTLSRRHGQACLPEIPCGHCNGQGRARQWHRSFVRWPE